MLKSRVFKCVFLIFTVLIIAIISTNSTNAYVLQGGYLKEVFLINHIM